jgi:tetratricopeptide (TPR) repeat protein
VAQSQERVSHKLAELLTRMGQREQRSGESQAQSDPDEALDSFDQALEHYEAAQAVEPGHAAAQQGEQQVKAAMEQLHMREGRQTMAQGEQAAPQNAPLAARALTEALGHFEAALDINPQNAEAESRAEAVRRMLPDILARVGQQEQRAGEQAEPQSPTGALGHYEEAQSSYQGALDLAPQHKPARQGLEQVEQRLAQLRQRMAGEAARQAQGQANQPDRNQDLQQLLGQVRESQRDRRQELDRRRQAAQNQPQTRKAYPDW